LTHTAVGGYEEISFDEPFFPGVAGGAAIVFFSFMSKKKKIRQKIVHFNFDKR
jgi:hypothetical protein